MFAYGVIFKITNESGPVFSSTASGSSFTRT